MPYEPQFTISPRLLSLVESIAALLDWWNTQSKDLSPVLSSAILHYRFESIHPLADGNGRTGRALSLWELYRRGFDTHHTFSMDEYYWEDRSNYYAALDHTRKTGEDLTDWLEYCAAGIKQTLEKVWLRVQAYNLSSPEKLTLRPKQERLLNLLRDHGSMAPAELWEALAVSRQGAMDLLHPLLEAGLVEKTAVKKPAATPSNRNEHSRRKQRGISTIR